MFHSARNGWLSEGVGTSTVIGHCLSRFLRNDPEAPGIMPTRSELAVPTMAAGAAVVEHSILYFDYAQSRSAVAAESPIVDIRPS